MTKQDCIFCKIARKEVKTENIAETENFYAFPDAHPIAKGHTLIIPKKHCTNIIELPSSYGNELLDIIKKVAEKILKNENDGFNIIINTGEAAGQVIMHAHIHIIPRKKGDNVKLR